MRLSGSASGAGGFSERILEPVVRHVEELSVRGLESKTVRFIEQLSSVEACSGHGKVRSPGGFAGHLFSSQDHSLVSEPRHSILLLPGA